MGYGRPGAYGRPQRPYMGGQGYGGYGQGQGGYGQMGYGQNQGGFGGGSADYMRDLYDRAVRQEPGALNEWRKAQNTQQSMDRRSLGGGMGARSGGQSGSSADIDQEHQANLDQLQQRYQTTGSLADRQAIQTAQKRYAIANALRSGGGGTGGFGDGSARPGSLDTESSAVDDAKTNWEGANRTVTDQEAERQKANVEEETARGEADETAKARGLFHIGSYARDDAAQANLRAKQRAALSWRSGAQNAGLTAARANRVAAQKALAQSRSTYGAHQLAYEKRQDDPMGLRSPAPRHGDCFAFSHSECNAISSRLG
jgi:hypothetical protein